MVTKEDFYGYEKYTLSTDELCVSVITLGAAVTSLRFAGKQMVLGHDTAESYLTGEGYVGAIVGRCANRIRGTEVSISGQDYALSKNEGNNQLHGGVNAFDRQRWQAEILGGEAVRFTLFSPDGENGYPGNLRAAVTYAVADNLLRLDFEGECDADTLFAPTTHMYFTLGSEEDCRNTLLQIQAERYLPVDSELLPLGEEAAAGGAFHFYELRPIGQDYDHCFLLEGGLACRAASGNVLMELFTDFPALQLYTGGGLNGSFTPHQGFAVEPEYCPDAIHHPQWRSPLLRRGQRFHRYAEYAFYHTGA